VALIAYDHPYPAPLHTARPIGAAFGAALVLSPQAGDAAVAQLEIELDSRAAQESRMQDSALEALRAGVPAARCLPLLAALARPAAAPVVLDFVAGSRLRVTVTPCS
jgi:hypothetical protein